MISRHQSEGKPFKKDKPLADEINRLASEFFGEIEARCR
jgi:hypothetical protein